MKRITQLKFVRSMVFAACPTLAVSLFNLAQAQTPQQPPTQIQSQTNCFLVLRYGDFKIGQALLVREINPEGVLTFDANNGLKVTIEQVLRTAPLSIYLAKLHTKRGSCKSFETYTADFIQQELADTSEANTESEEDVETPPIRQFSKYADVGLQMSMSFFTGAGYLNGDQSLSLDFYPLGLEFQAFPFLYLVNDQFVAKNVGLQGAFTLGESNEMTFSNFFENTETGEFDLRIIGRQTSKIETYRFGLVARREFLRGTFDVHSRVDLINRHKMTHSLKDYGSNPDFGNGPVARGFEADGIGFSFWPGYRPASWLRLSSGFETVFNYSCKQLYHAEIEKGANFALDEPKATQCYQLAYGAYVDVLPFMGFKLTVGATQNQFNALMNNEIKVNGSFTHATVKLGYQFGAHR